MIFPPDSPFTVYCFSCWWSDKWDGAQYAREYDFSRPFFEQYNELYRKVPRLGIIQQGFMVNSDYTNRVSDSKNCYLIFASTDNENCHYGTSFWDSRDSLDCYNAKKSEKCYECIDVFNCYNVRYSRECNNCSNSAFLVNCRGCESSFGCVNLRNKSYCIFNEQYSKEEYQEKIKQFDLGNREVVKEIKKKMVELMKQSIVPAMIEYHTTNVSGNWLEEVKNAHYAFNCEKVENAKYTMGIMEAKDVMDYTYWGKGSELMYQVSSVGRQCANVRFSNESWDQLLQAEYCMNCHSSSNLFGCIGMRKKQYCILNKEYSKEEYEVLRGKIIEHMNASPYKDKEGRTYQYGEYFPPQICAYPYNETIAQEFFPKTKMEAESAGYTWKEPQLKQYATTLTSEAVPVAIQEAEDSILNEVIACGHKGECADQCTSAFKITVNELAMYKSMGISLPVLCPNCRHYERLRERQPLKLWKRSCQCVGLGSEDRSYQNTASHSHGVERCSNTFETSYAPDRSESVYCVQCYQAEVA